MPPTRARAFDWAATGLSLVFVGGLYLDGWAHTHGRVDETFFTPWHAVLYSGFFAMMALLVGRATYGILKGARGRAILPDGYALSLAGVTCWLVGGPFDLAWHSAFGFEVDVEALLSPAHTILAAGMVLMTSGPLRAALRRPAGGWRDDVPMVLSVACLVAVLTFFTQIAHPIANLWAGRRETHDMTELGIVSMLLTTLILVAPLLLLLRLDRLPYGAVTIVVGLDCIATGFLFDQGAYPLVPVVAMVAGALAGDVLRMALRPSASRSRAFRWCALGLPVLLQAAYFAGLALSGGIGYTPHLWIGLVVFAGVVGWLLSYLVLPPTAALTPGSWDPADPAARRRRD